MYVPILPSFLQAIQLDHPNVTPFSKVTKKKTPHKKGEKQPEEERGCFCPARVTIFRVHF